MKNVAFVLFQVYFLSKNLILLLSHLSTFTFLLEGSTG